jgi:hypothetical protein
MARARNIKPGICKNEDLAECSIPARYLFACLPMLADREGLLEDRPKRIKMEIFPGDAIDVEPLLMELSSHGTPPFIVRYQNSDGRFIQITRFKEHQSPHYSEKPSTIKPPKLPESVEHEATETPGTLPEDSRSTPVIKGGSQPPDSLIPDSLIPDCSNSGSSNPPSKQPKGSRKKPATPAPDVFDVTDAMAEWAVAEGLPEARLERETRQFLDKSKAQGKTFSDWDAAWRTWIRNAVEFSARRP